MGWIAIFDRVFGTDTRSLAKRIGCSQNEAIGIYSNFLHWCQDNATEDGTLPGTEQEDIVNILRIGLNKQYEG